MAALSPMDAMFLLGETREQPMHVGGLMLFELPAGAGRTFVGDLYQQITGAARVHPTFARRVRNRPAELGYYSWDADDDIDLEYHVRLSGLARPGRIRELLELTSRLHGTLLDRNRPLWEMHLVDGIQRRRFAVYTKIHHALIDGISAQRWMRAMLTTDPDRDGMPAPYALPQRTRDGNDAEGNESSSRLSLGGMAGVAGTGVRALLEVAGLTPVVLADLVHAVRSEPAAMSYRAPRSMLNGPVSGSRRFAAQSWPIARLEQVRAATRTTLNDVLLAMCAGALRRYLLARNALPDRALVAMVPVSLRLADDSADAGELTGGNALATLLCDLATDEPDPAGRLERVRASTAYGKSTLSGLSPLQNLLVGAVGLGAGGVAGVVPGIAGRVPPPYNVIISNVPGPVDKTLYWNRSRLVGTYPASIVLNGQALNITVTSYDRQLHVGLVGCRRSVPHLQHLLGYLEKSLAELEGL